jgi:hypothetical protein
MADTPQTPAIDATPKPVIAPVKSGSGSRSTTSVNADAVAAGDFAYGDLGNGTAGGMGNAALLSTRTILPNTRRTQRTRAELEAADKEYTRQMNILSQHWSVGDTSSPEYLAQKQAAMSSQYYWELARNNLEEVAGQEASNSIRPTGNLDNILDGITPEADLDGNDELTPAAPVTSSTDEAPVEGEEIVVTGRPLGDARVRIRPKSGNEDEIYGDEDSALFLLRETDGVIFPYTPTIDFSHRANYSEMSPTHANTSYYSYTHSPAIQISISGQFSAQNLAEAKYTLACMHFFRTVTKMHFGIQEAEEGTAGLPPPVLELSGYGDFMLNSLNIVVQEFKMDLPNNVDYIEVGLANGSLAWVPALTTFNITCVVQQTPKKQRDDFNFKDFASGYLMAHNKGWL